MKSRFLILLVSLFLVANVASGATITVSKDGAGDYSVIQQALDAAASGDTVLIGPGSYTEYTTVQPAGWSWAVESFGYSELPYLTIIGAGADQTIIGPDVPMRDPSRASAMCLLWVNGTELNLSGVTIKDCWEGLYLSQGTPNVEGCRFLDCQEGVRWNLNGSGGRFVNTSFASALPSSEAMIAHGPGNAVSLENITSIAGGGAHGRFYFSSISSVVADRCDLSGGVSGLDSVFGTELTVRNSHLYGAENQQVYVYDASCTIESSVLEG